MKWSVMQFLLILFLGGMIAFNIWCGIQIHTLSGHRAAIKKDYSQVNSISYGLLSVNAWKDNIQKILINRIQDFSFSPEQERSLKIQISKALNAIITKGDSMLNQNQKTFSGKIKKIAVKALVNTDDIRKKVPQFSQAVIDEIKKPENRDKLKTLATEKIDELAIQTRDSLVDTAAFRMILANYNAKTVDEFNDKTATIIKDLQAEIYRFCYLVIGSMVLLLIAWWFFRKAESLRKPLFILSVVLAIVVLVIGLTTPMIEIDARIKKLEFLLLGQQVQFHDQVIFFQSKSILDVVKILLSTKKTDSMLVGALILVFSVIFPFSKLISTEIYLLGNEKIRKNKILNFLAFKSGKWSMADVTVVAIFMAYVGFKGILDNQLQYMNFKTETLTSIATNETSLQPGFIVFTSFVLYGLCLSEILKRISHSSGKIR
ncbi:MAG: paraquat-inducible protein A [Chitinophagales bacterium]|nr:paraquat-inducible protein A [Chitinophagales bacterium]